MHILFIIVEFIIILGIMVLVHEFGHFAVAKLCGVRVEVFSIGFGTRLFGVRYGDTDYRISILPLGGYVKMAGEFGGEAAVGAPDEFTSKPRWQRMLIGLAGPAANVVLSLFLMTLVAHFHHEVDQYLDGGPAIVDYVPLNTPAAHIGVAPGDTILGFDNVNHPTWEQIITECALHLNKDVPITFSHEGHVTSSSINLSVGDPSRLTSPVTVLTDIGLLPREQAEPLYVNTVSPNSAGARAGLQPGDALVQIDALPVHSLDALVPYLQDRAGAPATLLIERSGQPLTLHLSPEKGNNGGGDIKWLIGFNARPVPVEVEHLPIGQAIAQSFQDNLDDSRLIMRVLKGMFTRQVSPRSLMGPVGIAQQIDIATQMGNWSLVRLSSTISINLAVFNLLPFPPLDGAMILFLLIEAVMRRDVNEVLKERIYQVAFVGLVLFAAFVMFNDITRLHLGH